MDKSKRSELFSSVIHSNKGIIYKIANSYCKNNEDRNDLIQEIILKLWQAFDTYNEEYKHSTWEENLVGKAKTTLSGLKSIRIVGIVFGVLWCVLMTFIVIVSWHQTNWFFKSAFIIHIAVSIDATGLYVCHLVLLNDFNNNQSVLHAQEQLFELQLSNLKTKGILWLQLPVFSMWFMSNEWIIGVWLYKNLNIKICPNCKSYITHEAQKS